MTETAGGRMGETVLAASGQDLHLWALDLDGQNRPFQAHLITAIGLGPNGEERFSDCGRSYTRGTHPRGWWSSRAGELPLQEQHVHCGRELVAESAGRPDV